MRIVSSSVSGSKYCGGAKSKISGSKAIMRSGAAGANSAGASLARVKSYSRNPANVFASAAFSITTWCSRLYLRWKLAGSSSSPNGSNGGWFELCQLPLESHIRFLSTTATLM